MWFLYEKSNLRVTLIDQHPYVGKDYKLKIKNICMRAFIYVVISLYLTYKVSVMSISTWAY